VQRVNNFKVSRLKVTKTQASDMFEKAAGSRKNLENCQTGSLHLRRLVKQFQCRLAPKSLPLFQAVYRYCLSCCDFLKFFRTQKHMQVDF
jgi:hypothetical protein